MRKVRVEKLWEGHASIRDYVIRDCINNDEGLLVDYEGKKMYLSPHELRKYGKRLTSRTFLKKFKSSLKENPFYYLVDYKFIENGTRQQTLF